MTATKILIASIIAFVNFGCATKVYVTELPRGATDFTRIDGIPFRIPENYKVRIYELNKEKKYNEIILATKPVALPNQEHTYILHLSSSTFSNGNIDFQLSDDNTISSLTVNSTSTGENAFKSFAKGIKDIKDARNEKEKFQMQEEAARTAKIESDTGNKEDLFVVALEAKLAADEAQTELETLAPTASASEKQKADAKLRKARVLANQKARRAGIALPYPSEKFSS